MISRIILGVAMLAWFVPTSLNAQTDTIIDAYSWHQQLFVELDESRIPAAILLERTASYMNVANFTGQIPVGDSVLIDLNDLGKLHFTLLSGIVDSTQFTGIDQPHYVPHYTEKSTSDTVKLAGLFFTSTRFADSVFTDSLLLVDTVAGRFFDNPNQLNGPSPYQLDTVFAFAPTADELSGMEVTYHLDSTVWAYNEILPSTLNFDPDDGLGMRTLSWGDYLTVTYPSSDTVGMQLGFINSGLSFSAFAKTIVPLPQRPATGLGDSCIYQLPGIKIVVEFADIGVR